MILPYQHIKERCIYQSMIEPFTERGVSHGMTYGCGPSGYDVRIAESFVLRPGEFRLASTMERFDIPNDIIMHVHDKSSLARRGLSLFNTVAEPGWEGFLTIELVNNSNMSIEFLAGMPVAQVLFMQLLAPTVLPYGNGKYQNQAPGPQPAIFEVSHEPR